MLPAPARMRTSDEFRQTLRRGRRASSRLLVVHLDAGRQATQVGFVVGKSVGPAVRRNQVKRRLRHLMTARLPRLPQGSAVVVRALPASAGQSSARLGAALDDALGRLLQQAA